MSVAAMSVGDVVAWAQQPSSAEGGAAMGGEDSAVVGQALAREEVDGQMILTYAQKPDHELLKRDLALPAGKAGRLWRAMRALVDGGSAPPPSRGGSSSHTAPPSTAEAAPVLPLPALAGTAAALEAELGALRLGALQARARAEGVEDEGVEDALDSDAPKAALVAMLLQRLVPPLDAAHNDPRAQVLCAELAELRLGALQRRAAADGLDAGSIEAALDQDNPKGALISLMCEQLGAAAAEQEREREALRQELRALRLGRLQRRAAAEGVSEQQLEAALDGESPTEDMIELTIQCRFATPANPATPTGRTATATVAGKRPRPHHAAMAGASFVPSLVVPAPHLAVGRLKGHDLHTTTTSGGGIALGDGDDGANVIDRTPRPIDGQGRARKLVRRIGGGGGGGGGGGAAASQDSPLTAAASTDAPPSAHTPPSTALPVTTEELPVDGHVMLSYQWDNQVSRRPLHPQCRPSCTRPDLTRISLCTPLPPPGLVTRLSCLTVNRSLWCACARN
jgi:hypothetical protein